jgi:hypothetical protein
MTKKEFLKELKNGNVVLQFIGEGYNQEYKGKYNRYTVHVIRGTGKNWEDITINHHNSEWIKEHGYYISRSECLAMTTWGQSQEFEAKYFLVQLLFDKHNPNYSELTNLVRVMY